MFGKKLLAAGVNRKTIKDWSNDPQVTYGPVPITRSLYDSLEDTDSDYCLALCQMLSGGCAPPKEAPQPATKPPPPGSALPKFARTRASFAAGSSGELKMRAAIDGWRKASRRGVTMNKHCDQARQNCQIAPSALKPCIRKTNPKVFGATARGRKRTTTRSYCVHYI